MYKVVIAAAASLILLIFDSTAFAGAYLYSTGFAFEGGSGLVGVQPFNYLTSPQIGSYDSTDPNRGGGPYSINGDLGASTQAIVYGIGNGYTVVTRVSIGSANETVQADFPQNQDATAVGAVDDFSLSITETGPGLSNLDILSVSLAHFNDRTQAGPLGASETTSIYDLSASGSLIGAQQIAHLTVLDVSSPLFLASVSSKGSPLDNYVDIVANGSSSTSASNYAGGAGLGVSYAFTDANSPSTVYGFDGFGYGVASFTPFPEPRAWSLMLVGIGCLGGVFRRRRHAGVTACEKGRPVARTALSLDWWS